jgi:hypothetical protein
MTEHREPVRSYCSRCRQELTWLTDVDRDDPAAVEQAQADLLATHELECEGPDEGNTLRLTSRPW